MGGGKAADFVRRLAHLDLTEAFEHRTFFTRLHHFVLASDAFVVAPGGIGTVLEMLMIWQLLQVRHVEGVPLILVGKMWSGLVEWARTSMLDPRLPLVVDPALNWSTFLGGSGSDFAYGLAAEDRPRVAAFVRGVRRTSPLKFDHPGLETTATRAGGRSGSPVRWRSPLTACAPSPATSTRCPPASSIARATI